MVFPRGNDHSVGAFLRAFLFADVIKNSRKFVFIHAGPNRPEQFSVGFDSDLCGATEKGDLGRRFDRPQLPDEGGAIPHLHKGETLLQEICELELACLPTIPRVQEHVALQGSQFFQACLAVQFLGLQAGVQHPGTARDVGNHHVEIFVRQRTLDPGVLARIFHELGAEAFGARGIFGRSEKDGACFGNSIHEENGVRDFHTGEVHEIVVLSVPIVARDRLCAPNDCHPVRYLVHQLFATGGIFGLVE